ncbi:EAL domain-containing protein [Enterobacter sp. RIT418]|uniref:EAL domain-containing protein n=1 Tax=Enterobacter sp. RIT418 TaxID=2202164 RepID=UPI000D4E3100|nr:EAL domain-containing protein [Enterobacter sp. RIT 418]RAU36159.1 diguanylate phosphodiesterase [Enterobacter sp. RIT 418]
MLTGYKFESIRALRSENVIAWEVLSTANPHVDLEDYFGSMSLAQRKAHFFAQLRHAMFCEAGEKYYLNATSDLLLETDFLDRIKEETPYPERLAIEVTDLHALVQLNDAQSLTLRICIATLHQWGIEAWADDVCEDILPNLLTSQIRFCGIKIDKHTFWSGRTEQAKFLHLTRQCKRVASKVLIEGIETVGDFELARASVADYGQGYLWDKT